MVPADAEFVLEGYVDNDDLRIEGPFGDHTGVYSLADRYPIFHVTCITHRRNPIYAATVVGKPPMEDAWLGKATERIFLPLLQAMLPEVVDMNLPVEGGFHNLAIVSIRKSYPGQAKKVMNALWGLGHMMMLTRVLIVVDSDIDVQNLREVAWYVLNNSAPERDMVMMPGPVDDLDHGSYRSPTARRSASTPRAKTRPKVIRANGRPTWSWTRDEQDGERALAALRARSHRARTARRRLVRAGAAVEAGRASFCAKFASSTRSSRCLSRTLAPCWRPGASRLPQLVWITLAVLGARTAAMAANRFLDREIDARNPRTARRALASGALAPATMLWASGAGLLLLLVAAWMLNPLCRQALADRRAALADLSALQTLHVDHALRARRRRRLAPLGAYVGIAGRSRSPPCCSSRRSRSGWRDSTSSMR